MVEPLKVLSMGWGVQTWTMAAMMALDQLPRPDYIVFADTTHEQAATYAFIDTWTPWLGEHGLTVDTVQGDRTDVVIQEWGNATMIPAFTASTVTGKEGQLRRQCTHAWKIAPIRRFIRQQLADRGIKQSPGIVETWLGISLDEWARMRSSDVKYIENVYPLVDNRITRAACYSWLETHGLPAPPKSACVFCPYKNTRAWGDLKRQGGRDWRHAVDVDATIRNRRPRHGPLYVHPARCPLPEAVGIPEDHGATQMTLDNLCDGGHCGV